MVSGGKRAGAGRPSLADPRDKRVQISISVSPGTKIKITTLRKNGVKIGHWIDEAVDDLTRRWLQGEDLSNK